MQIALSGRMHHIVGGEQERFGSSIQLDAQKKFLKLHFGVPCDRRRFAPGGGLCSSETTPPSEGNLKKRTTLFFIQRYPRGMSTPGGLPFTVVHSPHVLVHVNHMECDESAMDKI